MPENFCGPEPIGQLYQQPPVNENNPSTVADRTIDRDAVWREFSDAGHRGIAQNNGLSVEENTELLHTAVVERAIELGATRVDERRTVYTWFVVLADPEGNLFCLVDLSAWERSQPPWWQHGTRERSEL